MKKFLIISLFSSVLLHGEPYKPYPILFIHGITGSSRDWGVKIHPLDTNPRPDTIIRDSIISGSTYEVFLNKILPYCYVWDSLDPTYTKPGDKYPQQPVTYPNKSFLEVINFDDPMGSLDPDSNPDAEPGEWPYRYPEPYKGGFGAFEKREVLR